MKSHLETYHCSAGLRDTKLVEKGDAKLLEMGDTKLVEKGDANKVNGKGRKNIPRILFRLNCS